MAIPSSLYVEDEDARQTLANGTVLKWSKKNSVIYPTANVETDRSICYTNWDDPMMTKANRGFHQWQPGVSAVYPDMGTNSSEGYGYLKAAGIQQQNPQPRIEDLYCGVVLSDGVGNYVWGYNPEQENCINTTGGADRRYLLDMDINKMIFTASINAYLVSDFENIDYAANPSTTHLPGTQNITLKQLYDNPDDYYINTFNVGSCYVYGEDTSDHWRTASIKPALILYSPEHTGQFYGDTQYSIFGQFYSHGLFSYDSRNIANHPIFQGGASTMPVYNLMNSGYCVGCDDELKFEPLMDYPATGSQAESSALLYWGQDSTWNHYSYVNAETWNYGASVYWAAYGARVSYNAGTSQSVYTEYRFDGRRLLKGSTVLSFLASFGLYFMSESFDPDTGSLTPETLGDDNRIMLGEMSADGTTTGRWITDIDSYTGPNKDGKTSNPDYDPSGGGGGGSTGDDMESMATGATGSSGGFTHFYVMSPQDLIDFLADFYTRADPGETLTNNIVCSYILGIPSSEFCATESVPIAIHNSAQGTPFVSQANYSHITATNNLLVIGSFDVPRMTNTFYDFAPYSTYEVFIPCCGWVSLPDTVAGRSINVEMYIDIASCCLKAAVKINDLGVCAVTNGILGAAIPIAVIESGILRGNNIQAGLGIIGGGINTGIGAGNGNALGIGFGVQQILGGLIECTVAGNTNYTQQKGGTGDITQFAMGHKCYMKVTHPDIDEVVNNSIFGHSVGYLCNSIGKLSEYSGFTVCGNPHVTFSASAEEREEIERLLSMGVIL